MDVIDISKRRFVENLCFNEIIDSCFDVQRTFIVTNIKSSKLNFLLNLINKMKYTNANINEISILPIILTKLKEYLDYHTKTRNIKNNNNNNNNNSNNNSNYNNNDPKIIKIAYYPDPIKSMEEKYGNNLLNYAPSIFKSLKYNNFNNIELKLIPITTNDILQGKLILFDAILVPGGCVWNYNKALKNDGKNLIKEYVKNGGGYIGICAGAYLGCSDRNCHNGKRRKSAKKGLGGSLNLLNDVSIFDYEHWARGRSDDCVIKLQNNNNNCKNNQRNEIVSRYCNGPLLKVEIDNNNNYGNNNICLPSIYNHSNLSPMKQNEKDDSISSPAPAPPPPSSSSSSSSSSSTQSTSIALFVSDFTNHAVFGVKVRNSTAVPGGSLARGVMPKYSAIVKGTCGSGRVCLISPHLEDGEPAAKELFRNCIYWCSSNNKSSSKNNMVLDNKYFDHTFQSDVLLSFLQVRQSKYKRNETNTDKARALNQIILNFKKNDKKKEIISNC